MSITATVEQSREMISALQRPEAYGHPVTGITLFETHISWVLLTGEYAYKIKKPVNFGFLDFSTLEKRHFYCQEEVRLNGRFAPQLYLAVVPICGTPEAPQMDGTGSAFEFAVKMRQFDPQKTFDELLKQNALTPAIMEHTATMLAGFHQQIEVAKPDTHFGSPAAIEQPVQENFDQLEQALADVNNVEKIRETIETLRQWSNTQHKKLLEVFRQRKQDNFIRECHGDLHLRNIMLWDDQVIPFDGIEFNDNLRWIDVMSELAFLLMDLDDHRQNPLARPLLNRYLSLTGDYAGLATLRYYQVYRAMVRAKVASLRLGQLTDSNQQPDCLAEIRNYIQLAVTYTEPPPAQLIITHGLSGSGKSYLAKQLALNAELIHLRSDVERKRLFDLAETARSDSALDAGIYKQQATTDTYQRLLELAETCIHSGFSVIVDATFLQREQRDRFHALAQQLKCGFRILDCQTETAVLQQRIQQRERQGSDASEATLAVLQQQLDTQQPLGNDELQDSLRIDTGQTPDVSKIIAQLMRN